MHQGGTGSIVAAILLTAVTLVTMPTGDAFARPVQRVQSAHFLLEVDRTAGAERVVEELESAYDAVRAFGLRLPARVHARMYATTTAFREATGEGAVFNAVARDGVLHLQPANVLLGRPGLLRTLRHELAHVSMAIEAREGLPRWVNEGVAMLVADQVYPETVRFASVAALEDTLRMSVSAVRLRAAYATAGRMVRDLDAQVGRTALLQLIGSEVGTFEERFRRQTGGSVASWADGALSGR